MPDVPSEDVLLKRIAGLAGEVGEESEQAKANVRWVLSAASRGDWKTVDEVIANSAAGKDSPAKRQMLATALAGVASRALKDGKDLDALEPLERAERLFREANTSPTQDLWGLELWALSERADILFRHDRHTEALELFRAVERLCRSHRATPPALGHAMKAQVEIFQKCGDIQQALEACRRLEKDCEDGQDTAGVIQALETQAMTILRNDERNSRRDWEAALDVLHRGLVLCQATNNKNSEYTAVRNQALALKRLGRFEESMSSMVASIDLAEEVGDKEWMEKGQIFQIKLMLECATDPDRAMRVGAIAREAAVRRGWRDFVEGLDDFLEKLNTARD